MMKPLTPIMAKRLAAVVVALFRPVRREQHPQHRRPSVCDRDIEIVDADFAADRRHHRLQRRIARRATSIADKAAGNEQEPAPWRRRRDCARWMPRRCLGSVTAMRNLFVALIARFADEGDGSGLSTCNVRQPCQSAAHLPTLAPSAPDGASHAIFLRAHDERPTSPRARPRPPFARARAGSSCAASSRIR